MKLNQIDKMEMKHVHPLREATIELLIKEPVFKGINKENKGLIEKSIYSASIQKAKEIGTTPNWDNTLFVELYTETVRHILTNLDKSSHIANDWLSKELKKMNVRELASLTPEELFPKRWEEYHKAKKEQENVKIERSNLDNIIICFKCKSNDLVATQAQTRSADEGMTQIFVCQNCGNRWKK